MSFKLLIGASFGHYFQINGGLGWDGKKVSQKMAVVDKTIFKKLGAAESEEASEPAGGENVSRAENRRKRKTRSFGVESKSFVLEMEERRGKTLITITESKKGVSSWVRMGMFSVGLFMEGLHQCIEDVNEGRWEKG